MRLRSCNYDPVGPSFLSYPTLPKDQTWKTAGEGRGPLSGSHGLLTSCHPGQRPPRFSGMDPRTLPRPALGCELSVRCPPGEPEAGFLPKLGAPSVRSAGLKTTHRQKWAKSVLNGRWDQSSSAALPFPHVPVLFLQPVSSNETRRRNRKCVPHDDVTWIPFRSTPANSKHLFKPGKQNRNGLLKT